MKKPSLKAGEGGMRVLREIDDLILVSACEMFLQNKTTDAIRDVVNEMLEEYGHDYSISRERVFELIRLARERGFFHFVPPIDIALSRRISDYYRVGDSDVRVVNSTALEHVAETAAELIVDLIISMGHDGKKKVHVGLGGGFTSRLVSKHLAMRLRGVHDLPKLTFHALSSGFDAERPHGAPVTFFGFFEGIETEIDFVGLFAPPVVATADYNRTIRLHGVKESFAVKEELDIVLTSLGSASHEHGDFTRFMDLGKRRARKILEKAGWLGDVQYRAYSSTGPINEDAEIKSVTLLELHELTKMAADPEKHVVVVGGPCGRCMKSRSDAVKPLFESPSLKVWSHFVMDVVTARELLQNTKPKETKAA